MKILSDSDKERIAETAEELIKEGFSSKPGWNFPYSKMTKRVTRMKSPDDEGDIEILVIVQRVDHDE